MNNEKRNQFILISVVVMLLITVVLASIFLGIEDKEDDVGFNVIFDQLYNSDYDLQPLGEEYFLGTYEDKLSVFIDKDGKEIYKMDTLIDFNGYYKTIDGKYMFYSNVNDVLNVYVFDGKEFSLYYSFDEVKYAKPIVNNDVIIGFTSFENEKTYLYSLDNEGFITLNDITIMGDKFKNNIYYSNHNEYIVVKNKEDLYGVVNISGEYIIEHKYKDIITLSDGNFIVKNDKDKYGIVDKDGKTIVNYNYDGIIPYESYYLFIKGEQMALYNSEYKAITKFSRMAYNKLMDFNYRDISTVKLYTIGDNLVIINNLNATKYDYKNNNMYIFKDDKYVDHEYQIGFNYTDKLIYSYDSEFNIKFYNEEMNVIHEFMLEDVKELVNIEYYNDDTISITYIDVNDEEISNLYNYEGIVVKDEEKVLLSNSMYYVIEKDNKIIIKDYEGNELTNVVGHVVEINKDYIIVDHILYRIVIE
ncbi:MAG: hypothetical protein ACI4WW_05730 [Candidatus Coprovivens sp.]